MGDINDCMNDAEKSWGSLTPKRYEQFCDYVDNCGLSDLVL